MSASSSAGNSSGPTAFRFDMLLKVSSTSKIEGKIVERYARGSYLELFDYARGLERVNGKGTVAVK